MRHVSRFLLVVLGSIAVQLLGSACGSDGVGFAPLDAGAGTGGEEPVVVVSACDRVDQVGKEYAVAIIPERSEGELYGVRVVQTLTDPQFGVYTARVLADVFISDQQAAAYCNKGGGPVTFIAP